MAKVKGGRRVREIGTAVDMGSGSERDRGIESGSEHDEMPWQGSGRGPPPAQPLRRCLHKTEVAG